MIADMNARALGLSSEQACHVVAVSSWVQIEFRELPRPFVSDATGSALEATVGGMRDLGWLATAAVRETARTSASASLARALTTSGSLSGACPGSGQISDGLRRA
jgi:hypothetical protein